MAAFLCFATPCPRSFLLMSPRSQAQQSQLQTPSNDQMIPLLQPSRRKISSSNSSKPSYIDEQRTRSTTSPPPSATSPYTSQKTPQTQGVPIYLPPTPTRTTDQLERPRLFENCQRQQEFLRDASKRHPVFFTEKFKKLPNGVYTGVTSPISAGYMYEDRAGRRCDNARL